LSEWNSAAAERVPLLVYGDESYDADGNVYAVAGGIGSERGWRVTEEAWVAALRGVEFHAARFETEFARDPDRTKHPARLAHYAELVGVLRNAPILFCCLALDRPSYRREIPDHLPQVPYLLCFNNLLRMCTEGLRVEGAEPSFAVTLDRQADNAANASALYELAADLIANRLIGSLAFSSRDNPRIGIADLIAREAMKEAARVRGYHNRKMRGSFQSLVEANRVRLRVLDGRFAKKIQDQAAPVMRDYGQWLRDSGRVDANGNPADTQANRLAFAKVDWPKRAQE
jgi:hypothetical protein